MKKLDAKTVQQACLLIEAVLIIASVLLGTSAKTAVCCYWVLTVLYHLTGIMDSRRADG